MAGLVSPAWFPIRNVVLVKGRYIPHITSALTQDAKRERIPKARPESCCLPLANK